MGRCVRAVTIGAVVGAVLALGGGYCLLLFGPDTIAGF